VDRKDNSRTVNIVLCIAGAALCIASGFISAPAGLLDNERANIISSLAMPMPLFLFVIPSLLMLAACAFVIAGRFDIPSLAAAVCGAVLFAAMDIRLASNYQMFSGVLINMIGTILVLTGVALQVLATQTGPARVSIKAAKKRNAADVPYERHHRPSYDDIYADTNSEFAMLNSNEEVIFTDTSGISAADENPEDSDAPDTEAADEAIMEKLLMVMSLSENENIDNESDQTEEGDDGILKSLQEAAQNTGASETPSDIKETPDDENDFSEALLSMLEDDAQALLAEDGAKATIAAALETPNQVMADFYGGIEELFLNE